MDTRQSGLIKEIVLIIIALVLAQLYFDVDVHQWIGEVIESISSFFR